MLMSSGACGVAVYCKYEWWGKHLLRVEQPSVSRALFSLVNECVQSGLIPLVVDNQRWHALQVDLLKNVDQVLEMLMVLHHCNENRSPLFGQCRGRVPLSQRLADCDRAFVLHPGFRDVPPRVIAGARVEAKGAHSSDPASGRTEASSCPRLQ